MGTRRRSLNAYGNIDSGIFYQLESGGGFWHVAADDRPFVFALLVDGQTMRAKSSMTPNQSLEPTPVGAFSFRFAVDIATPAWLSSRR